MDHVKLEITHHSTGCTPIEGVEMVDGCLGGEPGVGEYSEYMKIVALSAGPEIIFQASQ